MRRVVVWLSVLVFVLFILSCLGLVLPIEVPAVPRLSGWVWYLARTIPEVHIPRSGVATAAVCLLLLVVGSQYFLGWLYREIHKPSIDHPTRDAMEVAVDARHRGRSDSDVRGRHSDRWRDASAWLVNHLR